MKFPAMSVLTMLTTFAMTGCAAPVSWQKAGAGKDQVTADTAYCRSYAARETDRESQRQDPFAGGTDEPSAYQQNMGAYQARKSTDRLFSLCMRQQGYRKAKP